MIMVCNKVDRGARSILRRDPTRMASIHRQFQSEITKRLQSVKGSIRSYFDKPSTESRWQYLNTQERIADTIKVINDITKKSIEINPKDKQGPWYEKLIARAYTGGAGH